MNQSNKAARNVIIIIISAIVIGICASVGFQLYRVHLKNEAEKKQAIEVSALPESEVKLPVSEQSSLPLSVSAADISELVNAVTPSIVRIECKIKYVSYDFFMRPIERESGSQGSGFLVSQSQSRIYILTNNHVVDGATSVNVTFCDGTTAPAEIVGTDVEYDLAVIAVKMDDLETSTLCSILIASLGDSDECKVGSMAIAIGNALGYGLSTTVGYVSALDREVTVNNISRTLLQTDAAINPGNSGGPLLNIYGQVIGITSVKFASEEVEGMGYAIPITKAVPIINELVNFTVIAETDLGEIGIEGKEVTETYSEYFNLPRGIYIYEIAEGSAAFEAGLQVGDVITAINGRNVTTLEEYQARLLQIAKGATVTIKYSRGNRGKYIPAEVTLIAK